MNPQDAATQVGVSASSLRRLGIIYAEVYGDLPRSSNKRLWSQKVIEEIKQARALVSSGNYKSIKEAFEALKNNLTASNTISDGQTVTVTPEAFEVLLGTLKQQSNDIASLNKKLDQLQKQLEAPKDNDELNTRVLKLVNESLRQQNAKLEVEASKTWWQRLVNLLME